MSFFCGQKCSVEYSFLYIKWGSEANAINDEDLELEELGMNPEQWTPAIHLYFQDDLTPDGGTKPINC